LSVILYVSGDKNSIDINTLNAQLISLVPTNTPTITSSDEFFITQYLAGAYMKIPVSKFCCIELKALAGLTTADNPGLTYTGLQEIVIYTYPEGSGFGYNVGGGIKYAIETEGKLGLGLHLNINYAGSYIKYSGYSVTTYNPAFTLINSYNYNVPLSMSLGILQLTIGASLEL
jgi:hypothetical protein